MIQTVECKSWREFESEFKKLRADLDEQAEQYGTAPASLLFRGQGNSSWSLQTTLDRAAADRVVSFGAYYRLITKSVLPAVETVTGTSWSGVRYDESYERTLHNINKFCDFPERDLEGNLYRYMVYLRHHGFPSPTARLVTIVVRCRIFCFSREVGCNETFHLHIL